MNRIPYILRRNYFSEDQLSLIFDELNFINNPNILKSPSETATAKNHDGEILKNNKGIFLTDVLKEETQSYIWNFIEEIRDYEIKEYSKLHITTSHALCANCSSMLYSYYESSDHYKSHKDAAVATMLFWFYKEPKRFTGGNLIFDDTGEIIQIENNSMIMFPSWASHSVTKVFMDEEYKNKKLGRYCVSYFLYFK